MSFIINLLEKIILKLNLYKQKLIWKTAVLEKELEDKKREIALQEKELLKKKKYIKKLEEKLKSLE